MVDYFILGFIMGVVFVMFILGFRPKEWEQ